MSAPLFLRALLLALALFAMHGSARGQQSGANLGLLPLEIENLQLIERDADGYLYWVSGLSGRFGDFSILAKNAVFRLDRGSWQRLVTRLRDDERRNDLAGEMTFRLAREAASALAPPVSEAGAQDQSLKPAVDAAGFFLAWRDSWAGIFQELYGEEFLVLRHSTGEMLKAKSLRIAFLRGSARARDLELRISAEVDGRPVFLRVLAETMDRGPTGNLTFKSARLTTSESPDPGYDVRCDAIRATPKTNGSYDLALEGPVFAIEGTPFLPLPDFSTNSQQLNLSAVRSISVSNSSKFGTRLEVGLGGNFGGAQDAIHNFLGIDGRGKSEWFLDTDFSVDRGAAVAPRFEYELSDKYEGYFDSSYRRDPGNDRGAIRGGPDDPDRWRVRTQNRFYLSNELRMDVEVSLRGDEAYLSEFYEDEWKEDKDQETQLYFRYVDGGWGGEFRALPATNNFDTSVELLPEMRGHMIAMPLLELPFARGGPGPGSSQPIRVLLSGEAAVGNRRFSEGSLQPIQPGLDNRDSGRVVGSLRVETPFWVGPFSIVPYASADYLGVEENLDDTGSAQRTFVEAGIGTSTEISGAWGPYWTHSIFPQVSFQTRHLAGGDLGNFMPLGVQEFTAEEDRVYFSLRNSWSENPRSRDPAALPQFTVDFDMDISYFPDADKRPIDNNWSPLRTELLIDLAGLVGVPRFEVYGEALWDVVGDDNERRDMLEGQAGIRIQPEGDVIVAFEYLDAVARRSYVGSPDELRSVTSAFVWEASPKFDLEWRAQYDLERGSSSDTDVVIRRKGADFVLELAFGYDPGENNTSIGFRISPALLLRPSADTYTRRTMRQGTGIH